MSYIGSSEMKDSLGIEMLWLFVINNLNNEGTHHRTIPQLRVGLVKTEERN